MNAQELQAHQLFSPSHNLNEDDDFDVNTIRCVLFHLDNETYGIPVKKIREVLRVGEIRKVPGSPSSVIGVINVRGIIVTVVDARTSFNLPNTEIDDQSRIIIVEIEEDLIVGLMVDQVREVIDIPENRFDSSATRDGNSRFIQSIAHFQDSVIILVDIDNMFV